MRALRKNQCWCKPGGREHCLDPFHLSPSGHEPWTSHGKATNPVALRALVKTHCHWGDGNRKKHSIPEGRAGKHPGPRPTAEGGAVSLYRSTPQTQGKTEQQKRPSPFQANRHPVINNSSLLQGEEQEHEKRPALRHSTNEQPQTKWNRHWGKLWQISSHPKHIKESEALGSLRLTIAITRSKPSSTTKWNESNTHIKGLAEVRMCPLPGIKTIYLSLSCLI